MPNKNWRHPAKISDDKDRKAYPGRKYRAAYLPIVGENPDCRSGDVRTAAEHLKRVEEALEAGSDGGYTPSEMNRLYRMRKKWQIRAKGDDPRFTIVGNRAGALGPEEREAVALEALRCWAAHLEGEDHRC